MTLNFRACWIRGAVVSCMGGLVPAAAADSVIIPQPQDVRFTEGGMLEWRNLSHIEISPAVDAHSRKTALGIATEISALLNRPLPSGPPNRPSRKSPTLRIERNDTGIAREGYELEISPTGITLTATSPPGYFYGWQTLRQLLTPGAGIPSQRIKDSPRFAWRGMHLDESRHLMGVGFVKDLLDQMARHKLNTLHWHLTDGPGWRIEIPEYPRLTSVGAWRKDKTSQPWNWRGTEIHPDGKRPGDYGGYYTAAEVREITQYAKARLITIVPEIEMPGHSYAALVAYPELACSNNPYLTEGLRGRDVFCAANPQVDAFLKTVLRRTAALFPDSPYIHIGGDEVPENAWSGCVRCDARMGELGGGRRELQADFTKRAVAMVDAMGRRAIGWDEIADGDLPESAVVMVWRDAGFARRVLESGKNVVMTPASHLYFDMRQKEGSAEPGADGVVTLEKVYQFEPCQGLSGKETGRVLGVQGCLWTEHVTTPKRARYMLFPRLTALAEVAWSPRERKPYPDFQRRLKEFNRPAGGAD